MTALGIDTSQSVVSFAIVDGSGVLARFSEDLGRNLADNIGEIMKNLFKKAEISVAKLDRCGIVVGPGSFTGLRVGIAFAKGLFADSEVKVAAISSLECIARSFEKAGNVSVLSDARQDEVYFARFKNENGFFRICEDKRISRKTALETVEKGDNLICFPELQAEMRNRGEAAAKFALETQNLLTIDEVFPNYMQVSYAERVKK